MEFMVSARDLWQSPKDQKHFRSKQFKGENKQFACDHCGERFRNQGARNIHQETCSQNSS